MPNHTESDDDYEKLLFKMSLNENILCKYCTGNVLRGKTLITRKILYVNTVQAMYSEVKLCTSITRKILHDNTIDYTGNVL